MGGFYSACFAKRNSETRLKPFESRNSTGAVYRLMNTFDRIMTTPIAASRAPFFEQLFTGVQSARNKDLENRATGEDVFGGHEDCPSPPDRGRRSCLDLPSISSTAHCNAIKSVLGRRIFKSCPESGGGGSC